MIRYCAILTGIVLLLLGGSLLLAADGKTRATPPFKITADNAKGGVEQPLIFDGNVKFVSPLHQTTITCRHLETNAASSKNVTAVTAKGNVTCFMVVEAPKKGTDGKEKTVNQIDGRSEVMIYSLAAGNRIIRMVKQGEVMPKLVITDLTTKEKTTITGTEITYNLETQAYQITGGTQMDNMGSEE